MIRFLSLVTGLLASLWSAFVLSTMWSWHLVELGLPEIGTFHMWGISIVASMITGNTGMMLLYVSNTELKNQDNFFIEHLTNMVIYLYLLGISYLLNLIS